MVVRKAVFTMQKFLSTLLLCLLLIGCTAEEPSALQEVGQDVILYPQLDTVLDFTELQSKVAEDPTLEEFCATFHITRYKRINAPYVVCKTTDGPYVITFLPDDVVMEKVIFSPIENRDGVAALEIGATEETVRQTDPDGEYLFIQYSGRTDANQYSAHFFESGEIFMFTYTYANEASAYVITAVTIYTL